MIDEDIFAEAIKQYQKTVKITADGELNHVDALNKVLGIDGHCVAVVGRSIAEDISETYEEDIRGIAIAVYALQIGILAGRQEVIENTSGS